MTARAPHSPAPPPATRAALLATLRAGWRDERAIAGGLALALALYYLVPSPLLALPFLLAYAALAWRRLDLALCLLPLAFPFWYVPKRALPHAVFPLSEIALAVCVAVALARAARGRGWAHRARWRARLRALAGWLGRPWLWAMAVFLAAGLVGVLVARRPHEALRAWRWEVIEPPLYFALLLLHARGPRALRWLVGALLASAALLALLAVAQVTLIPVTVAPIAAGNRVVPLPLEPGGYRATAFLYGSGNALAAYLERAAPFALALALAPVGALARRGWARGALVALIVLLVSGIALTGSRGALAASAVALVGVAALALAGAWRRRVALSLAALVALALGAALLLSGAVPRLMAGHTISPEIRVFVWLAALHMLRDHPLFGIGLDQFLYFYSPHFSAHPYWITSFNGRPTVAGLEPDLAHPHNLALDLWLSMGVAGLATFVALGLGALRRGLRLWRARAMDPWRAAVGLGLCGSLAAGVVHGMVDSAYFAPDLALLFWLALALALLAGRGTRARLAGHGTMGARPADESEPGSEQRGTP
ncbi:MAG TPA: O-antigen ligase family protein [Ktedonobacterales bacterium]|nr:O-antigen ligase family protein [Ktedonobacterales bacterium]